MNKIDIYKHSDKFQPMAVKRVKYAGLRQWMLRNRISISELERQCFPDKTCRMLRSLTGPYEPSKRNIDAILKVTGLTYEECFKEI